MRWVVSATPRPLCPRERLDTDWVGPRVGLDGYGKSRPPPGFDPWNFQPVASRTDYAIPVPEICVGQGGTGKHFPRELPPVSIIPPMLHTRAIVLLHLLLPGGQSGECLEP
jgi:hypothetical protein